MGPRQSPWKWFLAIVLASFAIALAFIVFQPLGTPSDLRDRVAASLSAWTGGSVTLTEPLRVRYFPPSLQGGLVLSDASKLPVVNTITAPDFQVTLSFPDLLLGNISVDALRLNEPSITLKPPAGGDVPAESIAARLAPLLTGAPMETMRIHGGTVKSASGEALLDKLDIRLNARGQAGAFDAVGSVVFNDEPVTFSLDSGKIAETETAHTAPVTLKVTSAPVTARFTGTVRVNDRLEGDGALEATVPDARRFLNWVGIAFPTGESLKNTRAAGTVHLSGLTLTFDNGTFESDGNESVGLFALSFGARPRVEGTLAFEQLALDPYLPDADLGLDDNDLLDWVVLKHLDADLRVSAASMTAKGLKLGRGGFTINAKNGNISSEIGELDVCSGQAAGRLELDLSGERAKAALNGSLADIKVEDCLQSFAPTVPVKGSGTLKFDVSTGGTSRDELIRGLTGTINAAAENGVVPIDFPALLDKPENVPDDSGQSGWSKEPGTVFSALDAECSLSAGHLWCQSLRMQTGKGEVTGAGGLDVAQQTLDWDFRIADPGVPTDASQPLMESTPQVTLNGTLSAPRIKRVSRPAPETGSP